MWQDGLREPNQEKILEGSWEPQGKIKNEGHNGRF